MIALLSSIFYGVPAALERFFQAWQKAGTSEPGRCWRCDAPIGKDDAREICDECWWDRQI